MHIHILDVCRSTEVELSWTAAKRVPDKIENKSYLALNSTPLPQNSTYDVILFFNNGGYSVSLILDNAFLVKGSSDSEGFRTFDAGEQQGDDGAADGTSSSQTSDDDYATQIQKNGGPAIYWSMDHPRAEISELGLSIEVSDAIALD